MNEDLNEFERAVELAKEMKKEEEAKSPINMIDNDEAEMSDDEVTMG